MSNPTPRIGEVIAEAMREAGISENEAALKTGISRQTLRRRLNAGGIKDTEIYPLAALLNTSASRLYALAEERAA
jgi:DNA invertase Pin-like site-specific DNA recombinase